MNSNIDMINTLAKDVDIDRIVKQIPRKLLWDIVGDAVQQGTRGMNKDTCDAYIEKQAHYKIASIGHACICELMRIANKQ